MKILQLGAGSMGTRRLRDLSTHPEVKLALFDERPDRRQRARDRFGVEVFSRLEDALAWEPEALVVSTPPGTKAAYIRLALDLGVHHFSEADIWSYGAAEIERRSKEKKIVSASSASLRFLPVVRALSSHVRDELGLVLGYQLYMATYMPGWHPGEGVEYYARHRNTAPAREMIPFELSWLNPIFGPATEVAGRYEKFGDLSGDTEDTWTLALRLREGGTGQLAISMACPVGYRRGSCFGTHGTITWDIYGGDLTVQTASDAGPRVEHHGACDQVLEPMYREEIAAFVDAALGRRAWPQEYRHSAQSCATLAAAERSHLSGRWEAVDLSRDPDPELPRRS